MNRNQNISHNKHIDDNKNFAGTGKTRDLELMEHLYAKYAKSGTKLGNIRSYLYFLNKKYSWLIVVKSIYLVKRFMDIIFSGILLILLSPIYLIISLAIKIEDSGSVFYNQVRVGKWGKHFKMYKFRSMVINAEKLKDNLQNKNESGAGVIFKMKRDPRITKIGRIIRKLSIDELPQLWNVFKGDMSLVGPRPPVPKEVKKYKYSDRRRLEEIPGITCIWQVSGRSDIDFEGQVKLDVQYIESQSLLTDIKILLKTIPAVLLGKGAY